MILLVHGPNLNLLGEREPDLYGVQTLDDIVSRVRERCEQAGVAVDAFQSNHEGALLDWLHGRRREGTGLIVNPGALAHASYALRDCVTALPFPTVEVHLTNVHARESFRRHSVLAGKCAAVVAGLGVHGYLAAVDYLVARARG